MVKEDLLMANTQKPTHPEYLLLLKQCENLAVAWAATGAELATLQSQLSKCVAVERQRRLTRERVRRFYKRKPRT
jgi:hypothetical protein